MSTEERKQKEEQGKRPADLKQTVCDPSAFSKKCMSENEIKKRLAGRAMEYLMFLDD